MIARLTTFDYFNPLPRKEGDDVCKTGCKKAHDFNPLPRKEGDTYRTFVMKRRDIFQSTPS